ncbi:MAG TPA: cytochrome c1 [Paenalcaligenes hominis]|uniref:Cytochrome c1 n=2 Tax=Paenalcaligenes hominis TaxID=643674 RepID=A0A9D3ABS7_9BURK|nr:cytochrome c1 [Paenalcaligenes hominis]HJH25117.1 cytochrome c1 [Paenalcaligenes hominis]
MTMIKKILGALALALSLGSVAHAADGAIERAPNRINDLPALQNGAKLFVNYCLNCHSANAMRYNKLTEIGLTEEEIKKNLLFTTDKVGDTMSIAMRPADSSKWFGTTPPDLSVIARAKSVNLGPSGTDYIYSYLRTFYRDAARPTGWDNVVFPSVGMPHAMWELQGPVTAQRTKVGLTNVDGKEQWVRTVTDIDQFGFHTQSSEVLTNYNGDDSETVVVTPVDPDRQAQFDNDVADLSNFLAWMAEPVQTLRKQIGAGVMVFLFLFFFVAWRLNKEYWKDIK